MIVGHRSSDHHVVLVVGSHKVASAHRSKNSLIVIAVCN